jgi:predicted transcriptional regulator
MDARLDSMTRAKVDELATRFQQLRATVLSQIMQWGLTREHTGPLDQGDAQGLVCHLNLYIESDLHKRIEKAATAATVKIAPWRRHTVRQGAITDFPTSWQAAARNPSRQRTTTHSHDSRYYDKSFMLRLDQPSHRKLRGLVECFAVSRAAVIRQPIAQVKPRIFRQACT